MFRVYLACEDTEFVDTIKDKHRKRTQGKYGRAYAYQYLMDLGRLTYKNLVDKDSWSSKAPKAKDTKKNCLALATQLML